MASQFWELVKCCRFHITSMRRKKLPTSFYTCEGPFLCICSNSHAVTFTPSILMCAIYISSRAQFQCLPKAKISLLSLYCADVTACSLNRLVTRPHPHHKWGHSGRQLADVYPMEMYRIAFRATHQTLWPRGSRQRPYFTVVGQARTLHYWSLFSSISTKKELRRRTAKYACL